MSTLSRWWLSWRKWFNEIFIMAYFLLLLLWFRLWLFIRAVLPSTASIFWGFYPCWRHAPIHRRRKRFMSSWLDLARIDRLDLRWSVTGADVSTNYTVFSFNNFYHTRGRLLHFVLWTEETTVIWTAFLFRLLSPDKMKNRKISYNWKLHNF